MHAKAFDVYMTSNNLQLVVDKVLNGTIDEMIKDEKQVLIRNKIIKLQ